MAYTNIDLPTEYFNTKLYTGNGTTQSITGIEFAPKFTWIKNRTSADAHILFDIIRGATYRLNSNTTNSEFSIAQSLTAFNSDGFSVGSYSEANTSGNSFVSWNWRGSDSSAVSNTSGTITSTVSANTTSGFSIVSYTGNGSSSATVGHGLGVTPSMIILKARAGTNAVNNWFIYHKSLSASNSLIFTTAAQAGTGTYSSGIISTSPTSTTFGFTAGSGGVINVNETSTTYIAYCFAEVKGYSKAFSYTGNGSTDGSYVHLGFKPAFVISKGSSLASSWNIHDDKRQTFNDGSIPYFKANTSDAELSATNMDFLSNGFKLRTTDNDWNGSGQTYIGIAFATNPFVSSTGIPTTAR